MQIFDWKKLCSCPQLAKIIVEEPTDISEGLVNEFRDTYPKIKVYHSSRLVNPELCLNNGLFPIDIEKLESRYQKMMLKFDIEITSNHIKVAKLKMINSITNQKLYVALDDRELLNSAGHYSIYGSEYISALANNIFHVFGIGGRDYLKKVGVPCVFEIDLNTINLSESNIKDLIFFTSKEGFSNLKLSPIDLSFGLKNKISPESIKNWYCPQKVKDPLDNYKLYDYSCSFNPIID